MAVHARLGGETVARDVGLWGGDSEGVVFTRRLRKRVRALSGKPAPPLLTENEVNKRHFLGSILALAVAPAIVRADSLMKIVTRKTALSDFDFITEHMRLGTPVPPGTYRIDRKFVSGPGWGFLNMQGSCLIYTGPPSEPIFTVLPGANLKSHRRTLFNCSTLITSCSFE